MIKKFFLILLSNILLCSFCCFAENEQKYNENFEIKKEFSTDENLESFAGVSGVYSVDGVHNHAMNLSGTGALYTVFDEQNINNTLLSFDLLPRNITKNGFVLLSLFSGLSEVPVLSVYNEELFFGGNSVLEFVHKDWYNFKIIAYESSFYLLIDGKGYDNSFFKADLIDLSCAGYRFGVSGNNNIFIDNIIFDKDYTNKIFAEISKPLKFNCKISELSTGNIEIAATAHNNTSNIISTQFFIGIYDVNRLKELIIMPETKLNAGEFKTVSRVVNITGVEEGYTLKCFYWSPGLKAVAHNCIIE